MKLVNLAAVLLALVASVLAPAQPTSDQENSQVFTAPKKWAMIVGISGYKKIGSLQFPAKDAQAVAEVLQSSYGFQKDNVQLLTQDETSLSDLDATRIYGALDQQLNQKSLDRGDLFVFYFSGHGVGTPTGDYLMPSSGDASSPETTGLSFERILNRIVQAKLKNVLIIVDACRQGKKNPFGAKLVELGRKADIAVLLGCEPGGRSYEMPRFGQGLFTYSLIQAIKDDSLTDETSGALWASTLAKKVQQDVKSRSLREFGPGEEQIPAVWTEKTQDVLLGAYVGRGELTQKAMEILKETFGKVDKETYGKYLLGMGLVAFQAGKTEMALELWTTLRDLGDVPDDLLILLASVFKTVGREAEAEKIYADLWKTSQKQDTLDDVALAWDSPEITPARKADAAERGWLKDKSFASAQVLYATLDSLKLKERLLPWFPKFIQEFGIASEKGLYFLAYYNIVNGDFAAALSPISQGMSLTNDRITTDRESPPTPHDWYIIAVTVFDALGKTKEGDHIVELGKKLPDHGEYWSTIELMRALGAISKANREATQKQLETLTTVDRLWQLTRQSGQEIIALKDDFVKAAERFPDSGRARMVKWYADWATEWNADIQPPDSVRALYASEDLLTDDFADLIISTYGARDDIDQQARDHVVNLLLANYVARLDTIDLNSKPFDNVEQLIAISNNYTLAGETARTILLPRILAGKTTGRCPRLAIQYLTGIGDFANAEKVYKNQEAVGAADNELRIVWAINLALLDRIPEAADILKKVTVPADDYTKDLLLSATTLILSKSGDKTALEKVKDTKFKSSACQAMLAIAKFDSGEVEQLANGIIDGVTYFDDRFLIVQYACAKRLFAGLSQLAQQNPAGINPIIEELRQNLREMPDAALFDSLPMWNDLKSFVGTHTYSVNTSTDPTRAGEMKVEVKPDGKTTIKLLEKDTLDSEFTGTCSPEGIVIVKFEKNGETYNLRLRLAPLKLTPEWRKTRLNGTFWRGYTDFGTLTLRAK